MNKPYRILFVCMGNICRSPAGEAVLNHFIQKHELESWITCDSAGTIGFHTGNPPDSRMTACARKRGITLTGRARQISPKDLSSFDLILTMDNENLRDVQSLNPSGQFHHKIIPFCQFCKKHNVQEVPDPYYGGNSGFEHVIDLMEDGATNIIAHAQRMLQL